MRGWLVGLAHGDPGRLGGADALARGLGERAQQGVVVEARLEVAAHDVDGRLQIVRD